MLLVASIYTCMYASCSIGIHMYNVCMLFVESHCLVYWVDEDCVAVVKRQKVMGGDGKVGEQRDVKWGKKCYRARIAAIGKHMHAHIFTQPKLTLMFPVAGSLEEMKVVQQQYLDEDWALPWEGGNGSKRKGQLSLCTTARK